MESNLYPDKLDTGELTEEELKKVENTTKDSETDTQDDPNQRKDNKVYIPYIATGRKKLPKGLLTNYTKDVRTDDNGTIWITTKI